MRERVLLAMSGGVDSSVAAHLLLRQGCDVVGAFMRHGERFATACEADSQPASHALPIVTPQTHKQGCCSAEDAEDARRVADELAIPFYALNLQEDFNRIMDYFAEEYLVGRTPNPCIVCNNWLKFGKLFEYAESIGARYVATGHYARTVRDETAAGSVRLLRGIDHDKDQSYVLFGVRRQLLKRMLLPIGEYRKADIRGLAQEFGLQVAEKPDSQEICFVASGQHAAFVSERGQGRDTQGNFVAADGTVLGPHQGIEHYTVGQRRGLGIALGEPHYVVRIDSTTRDVVLGKRIDLRCVALTAQRENWLVSRPQSAVRCSAQIRYNSPAQNCVVRPLDADRFHVAFDEPCYGVAPGQAVVCYDGDQVLGGGWIHATEPETD